ANRGRGIRPARWTDQMHAGFVRRAAALLPVATHTAGDNVLPILATAVRHRYHVIEREVRNLKGFVAVLAGVLVARVDIGAGERNVIEAAFYADEAEQTDDRGQFEADRSRPYLAVVDRDHLYLPLAPERDRFLPVNNLEGLVRRVQEKRLFHRLYYD